MLLLQKHPVKNVRLMSIGSSITLYELQSDIIIQNFNMPYYNFAAWGLQITDMKNMMDDFVKEYQPKYVIICSSPGDFVSLPNDTYFNYLHTSSYIKNNFPEFFYLKNYNSIHQIIHRKYFDYPISFDNWGGASLNVKQNEVNVHDTFPTQYTQGNYNSLDTLSAMLQQENIKLIFIQAPIRRSNSNTALYQQTIASHFARCKSIVEKNGGAYLNYYSTTIFTDSLFVDQYHLRTTGAAVLTKEIVSDLKKIIK